MVVISLLSRIRLLHLHELYPAWLFCPWDSPGKNTGLSCYSLLQGIFLTQGSNPSLLHCRQILCWLSYEGCPIPVLKFLWAIFTTRNFAVVIFCLEALALALCHAAGPSLYLAGSLTLRYPLKNHMPGFPGGSVVKNPPANSGDTGSTPDLGRFYMPWNS